MTTQNPQGNPSSMSELDWMQTQEAKVLEEIRLKAMKHRLSHPEEKGMKASFKAGNPITPFSQLCEKLRNRR